MSRVFLIVALCALGARSGAAQLSAAKAAAQKAANATNAHIANEQRTDDVRQSAKKAPPVNVSGASGASGTSTSAGTVAPKALEKQDALTVAAKSDTTPAPGFIMREAFAYGREGRRDPFLSLLTTSELRPTLSDLKLTTILYDATGQHSLAVFRDVGTNEQYRVGPGATLGRMRITAINPKSVVFSIDEFGTNRQDSLVLGDTTKARAR